MPVNNDNIAEAIRNNQYERVKHAINNHTEVTHNIFADVVKQNSSLSLYFAHKILKNKLFSCNSYYSKDVTIISLALKNNQYNLVNNLLNIGCSILVEDFIDLVEKNQSTTVGVAITAASNVKTKDSEGYVRSYERYNDPYHLVDLAVKYKQYLLAETLVNQGFPVNQDVYEALIKENHFEAGSLAITVFDRVKCLDEHETFPMDCGDTLINAAIEYDQYQVAHRLIKKGVKIAPNLFKLLIEKNNPTAFFLTEETLNHDLVMINSFGYDLLDTAIQHNQYHLAETLILKDARVSPSILTALIHRNNSLATHLVELALETPNANVKALSHEFTDLVVQNKQYGLVSILISKGAEFSLTSSDELFDLGLLGQATDSTHEEL